MIHRHISPSSPAGKDKIWHCYHLDYEWQTHWKMPYQGVISLWITFEMSQSRAMKGCTRIFIADICGEPLALGMLSHWWAFTSAVFKQSTSCSLSNLENRFM
jgi:hypothetical protein